MYIFILDKMPESNHITGGSRSLRTDGPPRDLRSFAFIAPS